MHTPVVSPPAAGFLDGIAFGMMVDGEGDVVGIEVVNHNFFSGHGLCGDDENKRHSALTARCGEGAARFMRRSRVLRVRGRRRGFRAKAGPAC